MVKLKHKLKFAILILFFISLFFALPYSTLAQSEFSLFYDVTYDVQEDGVVIVTNKGTVKNLVQDKYLSEITFFVASQDVTEVSANDSQGPMKLSLGKEKVETETGANYLMKINITFNEKAGGFGQTKTWTVNYKIGDLMEKQGLVRNIIIPSIVKNEAVEEYSLTVLIPQSFGDKIHLDPQPVFEDSSNQKRVYKFNKNQLENQPISMSFGEYGLVSFNFTAEIENPSALPGLVPLVFPPDIPHYQQIFYQNINPQPQQSEIDQDGNFVFYFRVNAKETIKVKSQGFARLYNQVLDIQKNGRLEEISEKIKEAYTKKDKFWETDDSELQQEAKKVFDPNLSVLENARRVYKLVISNLVYDSSQITNASLERHGAKWAWENKDKAICMDFADLFITFSRINGIPAREVDGWAQAVDKLSDPFLSQGQKKERRNFHAWVQVYDPNLGWVMIDPTWEQSSKIDYFSKLDNTHFAFNIKGISSEEPSPVFFYIKPEKINEDLQIEMADETDDEQLVETEPEIEIKLSPVLFSGLPQTARIKILNSGSTAIYDAVIHFKQEEVKLGSVLPFSSIEKRVQIPSGNLFYKGKEQLKFGLEYSNVHNQRTGRVFEKEVEFKPIFLALLNPWLLGGWVIFGGLTLLPFWILRRRKRRKQLIA